MHFCPSEMQRAILDSGWFKVIEDDVDPKDVDADYVFDCRGKPEDLSDYDELNNPIGKEDILITPVIAGAGGDVGKIIIGAVLIGAAFYTGGASLAAGGLTFKTAAGIHAFAWQAITYIGAGLVFGGISNILNPPPDTPEKTEDPRESFNFSGITNTSAAGVPVPIVLGRTITGSVVVSAGIDTVQVDT